MSPRKKEFQIFSLSMLDVIASALGILLILFIILLPHYHPDYERLQRENARLQRMLAQAQQQIKKLQQQIAQLQQQITHMQHTIDSLIAENDRLEEENQRLKNQVQDLKSKAKITFLAVVIRWKTARHDVDLHITAPNGCEFYYRHLNCPDFDMGLAGDDTRGPGTEVWIVPKAIPGKYTVSYVFYARHGNPQNPIVKGFVIYKSGTFKLPTVTLHTPNKRKKIKVAYIFVDNNGNVSITPAR